MATRHHQRVTDVPRGDVEEGDGVFVGIHLAGRDVAGDDRAEQAAHGRQRTANPASARPAFTSAMVSVP
jgi:hypothetical protein